MEPKTDVGAGHILYSPKNKGPLNKLMCSMYNKDCKWYKVANNLSKILYFIMSHSNNRIRSHL